MPLLITCPRCQAKAEVPDSVAGHTATCRACGQTFQIPGPPVSQPPLPSPAPPPPEPETSRAPGPAPLHPRARQVLTLLSWLRGGVWAACLVWALDCYITLERARKHEDTALLTLAIVGAVLAFRVVAGYVIARCCDAGLARLAEIIRGDRH